MTLEERKTGFKAELAELLERYKVTINLSSETKGWFDSYFIELDYEYMSKGELEMGNFGDEKMGNYISPETLKKVNQ